MKSFARSFVSSALIASLATSLLCGIALGDDRGASKAFRAGTTVFAPIGKVYSLGEISINGHPVHGEQMIWNGDLIEASEEASAEVMLYAIGQLTLSCGAMLRLSTFVRLNRDTDKQILIASLISGEARVQLQPQTTTYIEASGSTLTAKNGASFRVRIQSGHAVVDVEIGEVRSEASGFQPIPIGRPVNVDSTGKPTAQRSDNYKARPNLVDRISILLTDRVTSLALSPGRLVRFLLLTPGKANFNSQEVTVPTNEYGVATATFTAGPNSGETEVTATVVGYLLPSWKGKIIIEKPPWVARNKLLLGAAAAAVVILVVEWPRDKGPLRQEPPPKIP